MDGRGLLGGYMRIFIAFCMLLISTPGWCDFLVFYDKDTQEVKFIVEEERSLKLSSDEEASLQKRKLPGNIKDHELTEAYTDYKLLGNNFVINTKKISDRENIKITDQERLKQKLANQETAKAKLMSPDWSPLTEAEFNSLIE